MGEITLNGKPVSLEEWPPSLLELVAAVEKEHVPKGWIIVEVKVDGEKIEGFSAEDESLLACDPSQDISISILSTTEILAGILRRFETYLESLMPQLERTVGLFRSGQVKEASELYKAMIEGIQALVELIQSIRETQERVDGLPTLEGIDLEGMMAKLKETIKELVSAQSAGDSERIADALEFDLANQLKSWQEALIEIRRLFADEDSGLEF